MIVGWRGAPRACERRTRPAALALAGPLQRRRLPRKSQLGQRIPCHPARPRRRAPTRVGGTFAITSPKSAGVRDVDIPPHIIALIEDHLAKYIGKKRDSLVFPTEAGGRLQPSTLYRHRYRAHEKAGRPDLRWLDLRALRRRAGGGDRRVAAQTTAKSAGDSNPCSF